MLWIGGQEEGRFKDVFYIFNFSDWVGGGNDRAMGWRMEMLSKRFEFVMFVGYFGGDVYWVSSWIIWLQYRVDNAVGGKDSELVVFGG